MGDKINYEVYSSFGGAAAPDALFLIFKDLNL